MSYKDTHGFAERLLRSAKKHRMKVAIGIDQPNPSIAKWLKAANKIADVTVVGKKIPGLKNIPLAEPQDIADKMIELLDAKTVDALVRGQVHPRTLFLPLFERMGMRMSYFNGKGQQSVCMVQNTKTKRFFVIATAELGQGYNLEQKKFEALAMAKFLKSYGIAPYVGVMTMRRAKPKKAKSLPGFKQHPIIDETYKYAEIVTDYLRKQGIKADMFNIEYETAINAGVNIILPPLGAIGNAFTRSLAFLSDTWEIVDMSTPHFKPLVVQHSFKTGTGKLFHNAIIAAAAEAVQKKYHFKA